MYLCVGDSRSPGGGGRSDVRPGVGGPVAWKSGEWWGDREGGANSPGGGGVDGSEKVHPLWGGPKIFRGGVKSEANPGRIRVPGLTRRVFRRVGSRKNELCHRSGRDFFRKNEL